MFSPCRSRDERYADFLQRAPGNTAMRRLVPRHQQIAARRDAAHRRHLELGAAVTEIADDAIHPAAPAIVDDGGDDHRIAPRRQALFEPEVQVTSPTNANRS